MAKMVLIEAHPLLRLGLWQILSKLDDVWEIEGMGLADVSKADGVHAGADLLIYGLPVDTDEAWSALHEIQRVLTPKRILLLTDVMPLPMPVQGLPGASVYGCLMKTASVEILEAAIRLVMAGGQCFPANRPCRRPPRRSARCRRMTLMTPRPRAPCPSARARNCCRSRRASTRCWCCWPGAIRSRRSAACSTFRSPPPRRMPARLYQRLHVKNKGEAVYAALQRGATLEWHEPNGREVDAGQLYGRKAG